MKKSPAKINCNAVAPLKHPCESMRWPRSVQKECTTSAGLCKQLEKERMHTVSGIDVFNNMLLYFIEQITRGGMVPLRTRDGPLTLEVFGCLHQLGTSDYESLFPCLLRNYSRLSVRKTTC